MPGMSTILTGFSLCSLVMHFVTLCGSMFYILQDGAGLQPVALLDFAHFAPFSTTETLAKVVLACFAVKLELLGHLIGVVLDRSGIYSATNPEA